MGLFRARRGGWKGREAAYDSGDKTKVRCISLILYCLPSPGSYNIVKLSSSVMKSFV